MPVPTRKLSHYRIPRIVVLMTAVHGKGIPLTPPFAAEMGWPAVRVTNWEEKIPKGWNEC